MFIIVSVFTGLIRIKLGCKCLAVPNTKLQTGAKQCFQNKREHDAVKWDANRQKKKKLKDSYFAWKGGSYACSWKKANYTLIRLSSW